MLVSVNPDNPDSRKIRQVAEILAKDGVIIYPTDTVYALGCDIHSTVALERIARIRRLDLRDALFSIICGNLSQVSEYVLPLDNAVFRLLKKHLPGPFTFILKAAGNVPKALRNRKKTVGIRIPNHPIPLAIVAELGRPILTTSLKSEDEILEYFVDAEDIHDDFRKMVDVVIDGGPCGNIPSTLVDCTGNEPEVIRMGAGQPDL